MKKFIGRIIVFVIIALIAWGLSALTNLTQPMMFAILMGGIWLIVVPILMIAPRKDNSQGTKDIVLAAIIVFCVIAGILGVSTIAGMLLKIDPLAVFELLVLGTCLVVPRKAVTTTTTTSIHEVGERENK